MARRRLAARRAGDAGERGATLVEFAIIVPILAALVFGIIEFGVIYSNQINLRQGTRDAARSAVVADFDAAPGCSGSDAEQLACLTRDRVGSDDVRVQIRLPEGTNAPGNPVVLCAQRPIDPVTGLFPFLNNRVLTSKVEMRIEQSNDLTELTEPSYPGTNWASACPA